MKKPFGKQPENLQKMGGMVEWPIDEETLVSMLEQIYASGKMKSSLMLLLPPGDSNADFVQTTLITSYQPPHSWLLETTADCENVSDCGLGLDCSGWFGLPQVNIESTREAAQTMISVLGCGFEPKPGTRITILRH